MKGRRRDITFSVLLGLAGFLGNWFISLPLFSNIDFIFGSFFVMLAIVRYGIAGGVTAGLLAGSCSYLLWNHPWSIIIFTLEAFFVALLNRRSFADLVTLDTIYWLVLGMPQVWFFYHTVMGIGDQATLLIALKQSVNGILNTMLATIAIIAWQFSRPGRHDRQVSFRQIIFIGMVSVALIPAFCYLVFDVRKTLSTEEKALCQRVTAVSEAAEALLDKWITANHQGIIALSQLVGDPDLTQFSVMGKRVELLCKGNPYLLRAGVLNSNAMSVAFFPLVDQSGKSALGVDFSDLPYIPALRKRLEPLVGDVVLTGIGRPMLPLLAPVVIEGRYRGYCVGMIDLDRFAGHLRILAKNSFAEITVLDRNDRVVISSSGRRPAMQRFGRPPGWKIRNLGGGVYHWAPKSDKKIAFMQRWRGAVFVKEIQPVEERPLKIVVEWSMVPYLDTLTTKAIDDFLLLWVLIVVTLGASLLLSKLFVVSLRGLAFTSSHLPQAIADNKALQWPQTGIGEIASLVGNFREMAAALGVHIQKLKELNEQLERRVEERTEDLRQMREELQQANELLTQRVAERTAKLQETIERLQDEIRERTRLGEALEMETRERLTAQAVLHENELLLLQQSRMAAMGEMIGNIAHQWRQPLNLLGLLAQELKITYRGGDFSTEYLEGNIGKMLETIQYMSKTIDDFRYFAHVSQEKVEFRMLETIEKTMSLVEGALNSHQIKTEVSVSSDPVVHGYPNQFTQVLLNILMNARDAFASRGVTTPIIRIEVGEENGRCVMTITDNAGGISEEIMDRIFDPYFTTKGPEKGTGVGLFMSKMIIQKMGGTLSARNVESGAQFRIEIDAGKDED